LELECSFSLDLNVVIWKPSEKTPLCAIACQNILQKLPENGLPEGISNLVIADHEIGDKLVNDKKIALVSFTGSTELEELLEKCSRTFRKINSGIRWK
jgi:aldehyde dehydrogenase (NAD+)